MLRKIRLVIVIGLLLAPLYSHALGLGEIKTSSALNQPFEAEIELLSIKPGELDGIKVMLASPEVFSRAGVERIHLLSHLKFETVQKANGRAVIRVFSRQAISEPYLNFLIEVIGPKSRLVREFSVLLEIQ